MNQKTGSMFSQSVNVCLILEQTEKFIINGNCSEKRDKSKLLVKYLRYCHVGFILDNFIDTD